MIRVTRNIYLLLYFDIKYLFPDLYHRPLAFLAESFAESRLIGGERGHGHRNGDMVRIDDLHD